MGQRPHVVVAHHDLNIKGGGETVSMTMIDALVDEYDVTLLTSTETSNIQALNEYFNTSISEIDIRVCEPFGIELARIMSFVEKGGIGPFSNVTNMLTNALYHRYILADIPKCDVLVSTWNEISTPYPTVQYMHYPWTLASLSDHNFDNDLVDVMFGEFGRLLARLSNFDPDTVRGDTLLVNSEWTAEYVRDLYGVEPAVLNPPIDTDLFENRVPWEDKEDGFVLLSRISPEKNVLWLVEILTEVRERGHDIHVHIIGPRDVNYPDYYSEVESRVEESDFIQMEGELWGPDLAEMLTTHRYGINGTIHEKFGMSVAEMVASGMIPFVPNSGGQVQIVNENADLLFDDTSEAVEKICRLLAADEESKRAVRTSLPDIDEKYGKDGFQDEIREIVSRTIDNPSEIPHRRL